MKKQIVLLAVLFFGICSSGFSQLFQDQTKTKSDKESKDQNKAQTKNNAEQRATIYTNDLAKQLDLTADQKSKVGSINVKANKEIDAAEANKDYAKAKTAKQERRKAIEALLTAPQKTKFAKMNGGTAKKED
jgi:predicted transglutaminase-like cysteine proteinase